MIWIFFGKGRILFAAAYGPFRIRPFLTPSLTFTTLIIAVGDHLISRISDKTTRNEALRSLEIDHTVSPVEHMRGGPVEANGRWDNFFSGRLNNYHNDRPLIESNGISALSPYLHFGHLSIHRVLSDIFATHNFSSSQIKPPHDGRRRGWWQLPAGKGIMQIWKYFFFQNNPLTI